VLSERRSEAAKAFRVLAGTYRNGGPEKAVAKTNGRARKFRLRRKG
jgi:hypothetical protein